MALLAIGRRGLGIPVDRRQRGHDAHIGQDMAVRTRHLGDRNVIGGLYQLGEVAHVEANVAIRAVGAARRGGRRMVRVSRQRGAVDHIQPVPLHSRLVAGLAVVGNADVVHLRAGKGHEVAGRVTHFASFRARHVREWLARGVNVVVAARAVVVDARVIVVRRTPGQGHQMAGAALRSGRNVSRPLTY